MQRSVGVLRALKQYAAISSRTGMNSAVSSLLMRPNLVARPAICAATFQLRNLSSSSMFHLTKPPRSLLPLRPFSSTSNPGVDATKKEGEKYSSEVTAQMHEKISKAEGAKINPGCPYYEHETTLPHPVWSKDQLESVRVTHLPVQRISDGLAYSFIRGIRFMFDTFSGYHFMRQVSGCGLNHQKRVCMCLCLLG